MVVGVLCLQACIAIGGSMSTAAMVFCAFALMIGGPVLILVWFGSFTRREEERKARHALQKKERALALLWESALQDASVTASSYAGVLLEGSRPRAVARGARAGRMAAYVAAAFMRCVDEGKRAARPILALFVAAISTIGFTGCGGVPPEAWAAVRPGMGTTELVSLVGGPDYVRSNGTAEVWQYCRDFRQGFLILDEGRNARYYTAILVDRQTIKEVQPYPVLSDAGCYDFYRAEF